MAPGDSFDDDQDIIYPSGKLGSVTRKKNEIISMMQNRSIENVKLVEAEKSVLQKRVKVFEDACNEEKIKNAPVEDLAEFNKWFVKHKRSSDLFVKKIEVWLLEDDDTDDSSAGFSGTAGRDVNPKFNFQPMYLPLPQNEPECFNGQDITAYRTFVLSFERLIEQRCPTDDDKFYYLCKYTSGEANNLVKSCHQANMSLGYQQARQLLEKQYGNEYRIAQQYIDRLQKWAPIKSEDTDGMRRLACFLTECNNMMEKMSALNQLNSLRDIREIVMKLPWDLRKQFRNKVQQMMRNNEPISFNTLVEYVNNQSDLLQVPILGDISDRTVKINVKHNVQKTFVTNSYDHSSVATKFCICCKKKNHSLDDCFFFKNKSIKDRDDFVRQMKLCYGCLQAGHLTKDCLNKLRCRICNKSHPSALHRDVKRDEIRPTANVECTVQREKRLDNCVNSKVDNIRPTRVFENFDHNERQVERDINMTTRDTSKTICPAIPVVLRNKDNGKTIITYMGLDNYSTATYMNLSLANELELRTEERMLNVTTIENNLSNIKVAVVKNLEIVSMNGDESRIVPITYAKKKWTFTKDDSPKISYLNDLPNLKNLPFEFIDGAIGILVGMNMPEIIKPLEILETTKFGPYASRHVFGWALNGPVCGSNKRISCMATKVSCLNDLNNKIQECFNIEFKDDNKMAEYTIDEKRWLKHVEENTVKLPDGYFEIGLPFKDDNILPNNKSQVYSRLMSLNRKLRNDTKYRDDYRSFMSTMHERNFVEKVPANELVVNDGKCWFLAHHGVYHKQKGKIRVVFDCSLKYKGISLNDKLWKGPDLSNALVGVLMRFRLEPFAVMGDIEKMFHMIRLPVTDRNYFRFFWYDDDDIDSQPSQYRMTVHLFGATTSPAIANYALKKSVEYVDDDDVSNIVNDSFYVDDMIRSFNNEDDAIKNINNVRTTLHNCGFNLTSFLSNSHKILESLPRDKLTKELINVDVIQELPIERALGIMWSPNDDTLGYNISLSKQSLTKRSILSDIFSFYDPLFLASPALVRAKRIFQITCELKLGWDEQIPSHLQKLWLKWKNNINELNHYKIPRCYKAGNVNNGTSNVQLHIFADGSEVAYGAVAYLRFEQYEVTVSIVTSRVRLTPISRNSLKTVPRIELNAAKTAVELYEKITSELNKYICISKTYFWVDSTAALQYIKADKCRFQTYVANRVAYILNTTTVDMWNHVPGDINPADLLSRGVSDVKDFNKNSLWMNGPEFLRKNECEWPRQLTLPELDDDNPEIKKNVKTLTTKTIESTDVLFNSTSNFDKLKLRVAVYLKFIEYLSNSKLNKITVHDLRNSELAIWKYVQSKRFGNEYDDLKRTGAVKQSSSLVKLNPFIDSDDIIRVGGRLSNALLCYDTKYPIILHGDEYVVKLMIKNEHEILGHMGRETVATSLRKRFHTVKGSKSIRSIISNCIICRKVQGKPCTQLMADLPKERFIGDCTPFTNCATDLFGPFYVSRGRGKSQEKRYGVIFTCLSSRASHIEIVPGLDTDSFINALRRFISRRGKPKLIRSDNGTNLTSSNRELKDALKQWNKKYIDSYCQQQDIEWIFHPPSASHFGGIFERLIRIIRKVLNSMLREYSNQVKLTDDLLSTLFCEIENILNSRPITNVGDSFDSEPLTPNHILRLQTDINFPPGIFDKNDCCTKRLWRQAQFMADVFWKRWTREYVTLLQERQKWCKEERSLIPGDIVLVIDNSLPRNMWCTGRVIDVDSDTHNKVRSVYVEVLKNKHGNNMDFKKNVLHRPVNKLILLSTAGEDPNN